jgi:hypothetical protein
MKLFGFVCCSDIGFVPFGKLECSGNGQLALLAASTEAAAESPILS